MIHDRSLVAMLLTRGSISSFHWPVKPFSTLSFVNRCNNAPANPFTHIRRFHAAPRRQSQILDTCLEHTHTVIAGLHTFTGLPWALSLPLTGLLVRVILITPLQIYSQKSINRQVTLLPLQYAWMRIISRRAHAEHGVHGENFVKRMILREMGKKKLEIERGMGIKTFHRLAPLLQLPIWLLFIETIRRMCGTHEGLLGLITKGFESSESKEANTDVSFSEQVSIPVELSMASEGALWFPDLLVPDPSLLLPAMLSVSLFANISYSDHLHDLRSGGVRSKFGTRLSRTFKLVALATFPLTLNLPSAMHLYWISSSVTAFLQGLFLNYLLPLPPRVTPCKPMQSIF